ncbi:hypothetical protein CDO52_10995 [Nocardiopsis gilva YIM 90087]|uniref:Uncharacterized protein n=1 Tax=Nocardiopsis gilva YIM 90087 TaxID=1235441 RepID=A0A223S511_9ACTN|nr:hypothetical protein [Nocardiopsis gilva]ASU83230.1 hypothetical protein CDO52_10995 [Nocardiopsis gilva YIM 90087]
MNSLVNIAVFGIVGAVIMAALIGLLLVLGGRGQGRGPQTVFGAISLVVLIAVPALAAVNLRSTAPGTGFGPVFLVAFGVALVICAVNIAFLPLVARRAAAGRGEELAAGTRLSPALLGGGLLVCAVLGLVGAGVGILAG